MVIARADHCGRGNGGIAGVRRLEAGAEGGEAAVDADLSPADRRLECRAWEGKRAATRERAKQHRAHYAAGRIRERRHVECHELPRGVAAGREQRRRVRAAIGERDLLGHRKNAMGGGDQQGLVGGDEAALDRARRLHQFGGEHHVDVAGNRHQGEHRFAPGGLRGRFGKQLHVVEGGAGALRHARHRGRLREIVAMLRKIDDPVGEHATALAAESNHGDSDGPHLGDLCVRILRQATARCRSIRRCNQPMTAPRTVCFNRSHSVGLAMIEAR